MKIIHIVRRYGPVRGMEHFTYEAMSSLANDVVTFKALPIEI